MSRTTQDIFSQRRIGARRQVRRQQYVIQSQQRKILLRRFGVEDIQRGSGDLCWI